MSDYSSPDLLSTSARPSRKRRRSPMTSVPALSLVSGALSHVRADLIPSPKRVRDSGYSADIEVDPRETSLRDDAIVMSGDRGIDQRGMSRMQRELRQMRRLRFYDRVRVGRLEACARKHMGYRP
ncbi:hypothetical protein Tco_0239135 [Tanacetum coccineum]